MSTSEYSDLNRSLSNLLARTELYLSFSTLSSSSSAGTEKKTSSLESHFKTIQGRDLLRLNSKESRRRSHPRSSFSSASTSSKLTAWTRKASTGSQLDMQLFKSWFTESRRTKLTSSSILRKTSRPLLLVF